MSIKPRVMLGLLLFMGSMYIFMFILLFLHRLVLRHEFILKMERLKIDRTMFAKLFDVKASLSSNNEEKETQGMARVEWPSG